MGPAGLATETTKEELRASTGAQGANLFSSGSIYLSR